MQLPKSREADLIISEMDAEILIYDLKTHKAFCLNETSARIWKLCDGRRDLSAIAQSLGKDLESEVDEGLIWLALEQLRQTDLVEYEIAPPESISNLSRRQALRKIGAAAVITLPLVSSIVAPTPINAASPGMPAPRQPISIPIAPIVVPIPLGPSTPQAPRTPTPVVPPIFAPIPLGPIAF